MLTTSESIKEISKALCAAHADLGPVSKSGFNKFDQYKYAQLADYVEAVTPILTKHDLFMVSSIQDIVRLDGRTTKAGAIENFVQVSIAMRIIHKSGEWIQSICPGEGQDRSDKSIYKAVTGGRKYAIACALNLATTDDPEKDEAPETKQAARPAQDARAKPLPPPAKSLQADGERATKAIAAFANIGLDQTAMEAHVGKTAGGWGEAELNKLQRWFKEVKKKYDAENEAAVLASQGS